MCVMPVLNLTLSNCALARQTMGDKSERNLKKCNSMRSVRKMAEQLDSEVSVGVFSSSVGANVGVAIGEVVIPPMEVEVIENIGNFGVPIAPEFDII